MAKKLALINNHEIAVKEIDGNPVVTFKDIDELHDRPEGTARKRFNDNKERFIEKEDYYKICASEIRTNKIMDISNKTHQDIVFLTQTGYLMLAKSFTDDLAWHIQRELVNSYFNRNKQQMVSIEQLRNIQQQYSDLKSSISNITIDLSFIKSHLLKAAPVPLHTDWKKEINVKVKLLAENRKTTYRNCLHQLYLELKNNGCDLNTMKKQYCEDNGLVNCSTLDYIESNDELREKFDVYVNKAMEGLSGTIQGFTSEETAKVPERTDPIKAAIAPLIEKLNDTSNGGNVTYRKVYAEMNVGWLHRQTRYKKLHHLKNPPKKLTLIERDEKLQKLFIKTINRMLIETELKNTIKG